jgi:hypothetical protein
VSQDRRFALSDALVLVAATAAGLVPARSLSFLSSTRRATLFAGSRFNITLKEGMVLVLPVLLAWTVAVLILSLHRPGPSWRRVGKGPGFVAAVAVLLGLAQLASEFVPVQWSARAWPDAERYAVLLPALANRAGPPLVGAWVALALAGLWRPGRTWVERFGRWLGAAWLGLFLLVWLAIYL